jgi:hypothetical protein
MKTRKQRPTSKATRILVKSNSEREALPEAADLAGLTLLFNTAAPVSRTAQLHASTCSMVRTANGMRIRKITEDLEAVVADLIDRGFPVRRCKCCR